MNTLVLTVDGILTEEKRKYMEKSLSDSIRDLGVVILDNRFKNYKIVDLKNGHVIDSLFNERGREINNLFNERNI